MILLMLQMREERQRKRSKELWVIMTVTPTAVLPVTAQLVLNDSSERIEVMHFSIIFILPCKN